jgi:glycosyltransferase involved in cell wall biosynthesis
MRLAMVSEHADPVTALGGHDAGGQNVHVAALSAALARRGHQVEVYTRLAGADLPQVLRAGPGVTVRRLPAGPAAALPKDDLLEHMPEFGRQLARAWHSRPPDLVHAHFWMSGLASLQAAGPLGVPVVQTFHALGSVKARFQGAQDTSPPGRVAAEQLIAGQCAQVIATCRDEVRELGELGVSASRVSVVPCGVDTQLFRPGGPVAERSGRPRLLTVGRLVRRKGISTVLAALRGLPAAELVVAGGAAAGQLDQDADYRRLRAEAARLGVADRVIFTGGLARDQMPALFRSADLVICVPWYEPFGIVPLEAMACAVPVVASAVGGLADTITSGETGLLVPARDPAALAAAVHQLLGDPQRAARYGQAGLRRVRHWYSWDRVSAQCETVYHRLLDRGQPPGPAVPAAAEVGSW